MRRGLRMGLTGLATAALTLALGAPAAQAEFGPIQLVSKSSTEQAAEAVDPAVSADGQFVAFAGRLDGTEGVFRKDLGSGTVSVVVELPGSEATAAADPSISADGRYVAFTTTEALAVDAADDPEPNSSDVYVADMSAPQPTYELASATDGSSRALGGGSFAAGRVALSEDGRRVAFMNEREIYVRELGSLNTILISVKSGGDGEEPVPDGGADTNSEGAAISGDGSTVAWVGSHLPDQVPMLVDEEATVRALESRSTSEPEAHEYHEPLWRRVPAPLEEDPPTRRVVGGGDPLAPGCPPGGTLSVPACRGPFPEIANGRSLGERLSSAEGFGWGLSVPRLDRDGGVVALVGNPGEDGDLFVIDMAPGLSRDQAVRQLTRWVNPLPGANDPEKVFDPKYASLTGPVEECAISPDGNRIAFTSVRQIFPLAPPTLVSPAPIGPAEVRELYQVNLSGETIERATPGRGGNISLGGLGATAPSYSDEGRFLAFASSSYNLVAGDTNGKSDAFVVESPPPAAIEPTRISPRPASVVVQPLWRMTVTASSLPDGRVRLVVGVPGAGAIRANATARLGKHLKRHRVAATHRQASAPGVQTLLLHLPPKHRQLAKRKGGLYAQLDVAFEGPGGKPLKSGVDVRFLVHPHAVKGKKK